ncbi:MAG: NusG domain II-containing protein [Dorea sp.]|nr:NusG domain II-containing protein [Dorea sp.]
MKNSMKKKDWILIIVVLCVAGCAYLSHQLLRNTGAGEVIVKVNGELTGTYSLNEDQEVEINQGSNILEIKNGRADMLEADCPDQLCVHQKAVSASNENIICLPNKVIVEIRSRTDSQIDTVAN